MRIELRTVRCDGSAVRDSATDGRDCDEQSVRLVES